MLKLRFSEPSFKKYMDGKICVCIYECKIIESNTKEILDSFKVSGTAKLAEGDSISNLGVKLADSRAKLLAYKRAANLISQEQYNSYTEEINEMVTLCEFSDFMHYMKRKEINHIKFLEKEG